MSAKSFRFGTLQRGTVQRTLHTGYGRTSSQFAPAPFARVLRCRVARFALHASLSRRAAVDPRTGAPPAAPGVRDKKMTRSRHAQCAMAPILAFAAPGGRRSQIGDMLTVRILSAAMRRTILTVKTFRESVVLRQYAASRGRMDACRPRRQSEGVHSRSRRARPPRRRTASAHDSHEKPLRWELFVYLRQTIPQRCSCHRFAIFDRYGRSHRCLSQPCRDVVESDMAAALSRDQASLHSHMFAARTVFIDPAHQQRQPRDERARPSGRAVEAARTFERTVVTDRRDGVACYPSGSWQLMGPGWSRPKRRINPRAVGERGGKGVPSRF